MIQKNPDSEMEFFQTIQEGSIDNSTDNGITYEINNLHPELQFVDSELISEDGTNQRVILYYYEETIYLIAKNEENDSINITMYLPLDDPRLDDLKDAVENN